MDFIETTKQLWNTYFWGDIDANCEQIKLFAPDCIIIGTGKHEFYRNLEAFLQTIRPEISEREQIQFQYKDFWCEEKRLSEDTCLVYGGLFVYWKSEDEQIAINMDSRFTIIYTNTPAGWKITHVHQSIPNYEQQEGEYYPKTLSEEYRKEKEKVSQLIHLAEKDSLTQVINYRTFENLYPAAAKDRDWFFIVDLDDFKSINDVFGHITGNRILKETALILQESVEANDLVCRMGGDEFILLCRRLKSKKRIEQFLSTIKERINQIPLPGNQQVTLSIGGTKVRAGESVTATLERADMHLYQAKASGKNSWIIDESI